MGRRRKRTNVEKQIQILAILVCVLALGLVVCLLWFINRPHISNN